MQIIRITLLLFIALALTSCTGFEYGSVSNNKTYDNRIFPVNSLNGKFNTETGNYLLDLEERYDSQVKDYLKVAGKPDYIYRDELLSMYLIYLSPPKSIHISRSLWTADLYYIGLLGSGAEIVKTNSIPKNIQAEIINFYSLHEAGSDTINEDNDGNCNWFISLCSEVNQKYKNGTGFNDEILQRDLKTSDKITYDNLIKWADSWSAKAETAITPETETYMQQEAETISKNNELLKLKIKELMINYIKENWDQINSNYPVNIKHNK